ncbi:hypothetical protein LZG35_13285 [Alcanivorax xenomutans]|uniref:Uncharacterized protein n=1 Tax=Alloalcanivorax xenomutans TaxID=1094342 RepID=A0A9Q3W5L9_9GAMM|nr:hypothetical protein [Alloalcanivorax xenomutans]
MQHALVDVYRECLMHYRNMPLFRDPAESNLIIRVDRLLLQLLAPENPQWVEETHRYFREAWEGEQDHANWADTYRNNVRAYVRRRGAHITHGLVSEAMAALQLDAFLDGLKVSQGIPVPTEFKEEQDALMDTIEALFPGYYQWKADNRGRYSLEVVRTPRDEKDEDHL